MDTLGHKLCALTAVFVSIFAATALPVKLSSWFRRKGDVGRDILSGVMCFGGGVFLGTYLLHMTPEVETIISRTISRPRSITYPIAHLIIGVGFFSMMFLERLSHDMQKRRSKAAAAGKSTGGSKSKVQVAVDASDSSNASLPSPIVGNNTRQRNNVSAEELANNHHTGNDVAIANQQRKRAVVDAPTPVLIAPNHGTVNRAFTTDEFPDANSSPTIVANQSDKGPNDQFAGASTGRTIFLLLALAIDSLFEGLSLGLQKNASGVWRMVLAILSHELAVGFSLGLQLAQYNPPLRTVGVALFYGAVCPAGVAIGIIVVETTQGGADSNIDLLYGVLLALTAGVFLSVAFFGILLHEINEDCKIQNLFAVLLGFSIMAALLYAHDFLIPHAQRQASLSGLLSGPLDNSTSHG